MALITEFTELQKERNQVHGVVECGYSSLRPRARATYNSTRSGQQIGRSPARQANRST